MSEPLVLDEAVIERFRAATGGKADPCFQCGACTATCPWNMVRDEPLSVRSLVRAAQLGVDGSADAWLCTACGACEAACPRGVPVAEVMTGLRALSWEEKTEPEGMPGLMWSYYWNGNPYGGPPSERGKWAAGMKLEAFDAAKHEVLLYAGCAAAYDRRTQKIAKALAALLEFAGVKFGILGEAEPCCGDCVRRLGQPAYFVEMAAAASKKLAEKGVKTLVALSPHCYDAYKEHIPAPAAEFRVLHYTQYLAELMKAGRLTVKKPLALRAAFHDPCFLGRRHGEYEAPRALLGAVEQLELVELPRAREDGLCCGGGAGRMFLETPPEQRVANLRIAEADEAKAEALVTSCPFCVTCLEDAARVKNSKVKVLDLAEVLVAAARTKSAHEDMWEVEQWYGKSGAQAGGQRG